MTRKWILAVLAAVVCLSARAAILNVGVRDVGRIDPTNTYIWYGGSPFTMSLYAYIYGIATNNTDHAYTDRATNGVMLTVSDWIADTQDFARSSALAAGLSGTADFLRVSSFESDAGLAGTADFARISYVADGLSDTSDFARITYVNSGVAGLSNYVTASGLIETNAAVLDAKARDTIISNGVLYRTGGTMLGDIVLDNQILTAGTPNVAYQVSNTWWPQFISVTGNLFYVKTATGLYSYSANLGASQAPGIGRLGGYNCVSPSTSAGALLFYHTGLVCWVFQTPSPLLMATNSGMVGLYCTISNLENVTGYAVVSTNEYPAIRVRSKDTNYFALTKDINIATNAVLVYSDANFVRRTSDYLWAGDMYSTNTDSTFSDDELMRYQDVYRIIELSSDSELFGSATPHPYIPSAGTMVHGLPGGWGYTNTVAGNSRIIVGDFYYTNAIIGFAPAGQYIGHFHAAASANGRARGRIALIVEDGLGHTNFLGNSDYGDLIQTSVGSFDVNVSVMTNYTGRYLGVRYYLTNTVAPSVNVYTYGGIEEFDTHLSTPNLNARLNTVTPAELNAATNAALMKAGGVMTGKIDFGQQQLTNIGSFCTPCSVLTIRVGAVEYYLP